VLQRATFVEIAHERSVRVLFFSVKVVRHKKWIGNNILAESSGKCKDASDGGGVCS
jgi:hypothetical protein